MKNRKLSVVFFTTLLIVSFTVSCGDSGDTAKPTITINTPTEEAAFEPGSTLHLDMQLSDSEAIDEYKIEIHLAAGHTRADADELPSIYQNSWSDASGRASAHIEHDIVLPATSAEGDYHLMVYCTDLSGNEAHVVRTVEIIHDDLDHAE